MKDRKRGWMILSVALCVICLVGCGERSRTNRRNVDGTWAVYWYLCGSDLESEDGAATDDLLEMMEVELSENVEVIIQTGGTSEWMNDMVDPEMLQRYSYSREGLELVDEQPSANMGDADTLADFLSFCEENYPADHTAVIFWNHGGGSVGGVAYDELYDYDSLSLDEIHEGFQQVYPLSVDAPPIDLIGFDACLMATIDTAYMASDIARYMVASEEMEPGNGWYYEGWLKALNENPQMSVKELGTVICDTYAEGCEMEESEDEITLSVVDLSLVPDLAEAYDKIGAEALSYVCEDPYFYAAFARSAQAAENYGGNTDATGYGNMVDLGDFVRSSQDILPESADAVLDALRACVVYKVNGSYREYATGLSCYFSYDGDLESCREFRKVTPSDAFDYFYCYGLGDELPAEAEKYFQELGGYSIAGLPQIPTVENISSDDVTFYLDEENSAVLDLGPELASILKTVVVQLDYMEYDEDYMLMLGTDTDLIGDWEKGIFKDNFWGTWGAIDDHLCYMDVVYEGEDYNLYAIPVLLNGEECTLSVVYNYQEEAYDILGARKGLDENGMSDKNLIKLQPGDEITTLHYKASISGDDDFIQIPMDTFTVTEETAFDDTELKDGEYVLTFNLIDVQNNLYASQPVYFVVEGDDIYSFL